MIFNNKLDVLWKGGLLTLALLAITIAGCDSMSSSTADEASTIVPNLQQQNLSAAALATNSKLERISRAVAKVLADDDIRQYVYARIMEKRTGEPTVLWMQLNEAKKGDVPTAMQLQGAKKWGRMLLQQTQGALGQVLIS